MLVFFFACYVVTLEISDKACTHMVLSLSLAKMPFFNESLILCFVSNIQSYGKFAKLDKFNR